MVLWVCSQHPQSELPNRLVSGEAVVFIIFIFSTLLTRKTCLHLLNCFALMSRLSADADGFIPPLSQYGVDGENSHPNIQSNDPSKLVDTSDKDVNSLPNDSSTHDSSVFESNTQPDDHIDSYRRFRLHQEKTYRPNGYGFLRNTEFDSRSDNGYTFVTNVICDILFLEYGTPLNLGVKSRQEDTKDPYLVDMVLKCHKQS